MYVCICHGITDRQIRHAVDEGATSLGELQMQLPVGGCCGRCVDSAEALIQEHQHQSGAAVRTCNRGGSRAATCLELAPA